MAGALAFSTLAACITCLTLLGVLSREVWTRRNLGAMTAFAAASLIGAALLHAVPEAILRDEWAPVWLFAGFAGAYLFDRGVLGHHRIRGREEAAAALFAVSAIAIHSVIDGLSYAVAFTLDWRTGAVSTIGLLLHEAPEAVIVFTLLTRAGFKTKAAAFATLAAAGLTTPLGTGLGLTALSIAPDAAVAALFAAIAGVLLFIGAGHLLPHVEKEPARRILPAMALGVAIAVAGAVWHGPIAREMTGADAHAGHEH